MYMFGKCIPNPNPVDRFHEGFSLCSNKKNTEIGLLTSKLTLYGNVSGKLSPSRLLYHLHSSVL